MGYKGVIRSGRAKVRRFSNYVDKKHKAHVRTERKHARELEAEVSQLEKEMKQASATLEVAQFEAHIDCLISLHKECESSFDWNELKDLELPSKPTSVNKRQMEAQEVLKNYRSGFFERLFNREEKKRQLLQGNIETAKVEDDKEYKELLEEYEKDINIAKNFKQTVDKVLTGDLNVYEELVHEYEPFAEIMEYGSGVEIEWKDSMHVIATIKVHGEEVLPSERKMLTQTGKLSVKAITKTDFFAYYQDYVCSCAIRVARELFGFLPHEKAIVHAVDNRLNTKTGRDEDFCILSVEFSKNELESLKFEFIDPSDALENFRHNMDFKKTKSMSEVEKLSF